MDRRRMAWHARIALVAACLMPTLILPMILDAVSRRLACACASIDEGGMHRPAPVFTAASVSLTCLALIAGTGDATTPAAPALIGAAIIVVVIAVAVVTGRMAGLVGSRTGGCVSRFRFDHHRAAATSSRRRPQWVPAWPCFALPNPYRFD